LGRAVFVDGAAYLASALGGRRTTPSPSPAFVERTFGGSLVPLVTCFVSRKQLSAGEIAELQDLAAKLEPPKKEEAP